MIKIFSPETFNDYDDKSLYNCVYGKEEREWYLNHLWLEQTLTNSDYSEYVNNTYANLDDFLTQMDTAGYISRGESHSLILYYDPFVASLKSWFDIVRVPRTSYLDDNKQTETLDITRYGDVYLEPSAFKTWVLDNSQYFPKSFKARKWLQKQLNAKVINYVDKRGRIRKPKTFKNNLKKAMVDYYTTGTTKKKRHTVNKDKIIYNMFVESEAGINVVYDIDRPLLYYIFQATEQRKSTYKLELSGLFPVIGNGALEYVDLSNLRGVISEDTIEGYTLFGISATKTPMYFLDYTMFSNGVISEATAKGINLPDGITPLDFVNGQVQSGILIDYTNSEYGIINNVTTRYRIINLDYFRSNYSVYRMGVNITDLVSGNGDMILMPSQCDLEAEINGSWTITIQHPYDEEGRNTFIQKGSILAVSSRIAREQAYTNQLFRIYDVQNSFNGVEVTAYPVAMESSFECPIDNLYLENVNAIEVCNSLTSLYPEKYLVATDIQNGSTNIYAQNTNMQEIINGTDDASFINTFGGEVIYDNYTYKIMAQAGRRIENSKDYLIQYSADMKGITINENTFDVVTRVYPTSNEGYNFASVQAAFNDYVTEFGSLTAKVVSGYYFRYNDLTSAVAKFDKNLDKADPDEGYTAIGKKFDSSSASGFEPLNAVETQIPGDFDNKLNIHKACARFVGAICKAGLVTQILDPNGVDIYGNRTLISPAANEVLAALGMEILDIDASKLAGSVIYLNIPSMEVAGNKALNFSYPDSFITELNNLRPTMLASTFMSTLYTDVIMNDPAQVPRYVDAPNIRNFPFVHARSIMHSEISLIEEYDADSDVQENDTMLAVEKAMAAIKAKTASLSKRYLELAHNGKWDHKKRIKTKSQTIHYTGEAALSHIHTAKYNPRTDRVKLPYGYILYSFKDAIGYLKEMAVTSWCKDENEAEIFCRAIENGFQWCEKTNIAKWQWHKDKNGKYYGTSKRTGDIVSYRYHQVDGKWYYFDENGNVKQTPINLEEYKWEEEEYEVTKKDEDGNIEYEDDGITPKKEKKRRHRYMNADGNYLKDVWIEENKSKHYYVGSDGYRKIFKVENGKDKDGNTQYKEMDYDDSEWSFQPGEEGTTYKVTGYTYGNRDKKHFPVKGQYMYIKEYKGWFRFDDNKGTVQGNYMSDASWNWKKYKKGWRFTDGNRTYLWGQWAKIDGKWYWFTAKGGYADNTTDDFSENSQSFKTDDKKPSIDYNREGVSSIGDHETKASDDKEYNADRDGVKAWIQDDFVKDLKKEILKQHNNIWDALRGRLWAAACEDIEQLRNESISIEVDFELLRNYVGYEQLKFLEDLYLGDYVHVISSLHNYEGDLRVVGITYDCITNRPKTMSLGYPMNSFIKRAAAMNASGIIKHYHGPELRVNEYVTKNDDGTIRQELKLVPRYIEDGYGGFIDDGSTTQPYIPV